MLGTQFTREDTYSVLQARDLEYLLLNSVPIMMIPTFPVRWIWTLARGDFKLLFMRVR